MKKTLFAILKEIRTQKRLTFLFVLNLSLGLSGFIALDSFRNSIDKSLSARSRSVLGADLGISSRQPIDPVTLENVRTLLGSDIEKSQMIELYSMVANLKGDSRLIQIRAIDGNYPFYGTLDLREGGPQKSGLKRNIHIGPTAWVYPEILLQLHLKIGDQIRIGKSVFTIGDVITSDTSVGISTTMAPRLYIDLKKLQATQLVTSESLAWYSYLYHLPNFSNNQLKEIEQSLLKNPQTPRGTKVYSHQSSSEQLGRLLNYLSDYLGLVALSALFLSGVGTAFLFRSYFNSKIYQIAILLSLGVTPLTIFLATLTQVAILGLLGSLPAIILSRVLLPTIAQITKQLLPVQLNIYTPNSTLALALIMGSVSSVLVCLPIANRIRNLKPALLFRGISSLGNQWGKSSLFAALPALISFWGLAVWQAHSWTVGSIFTGLFLGAGLTLGTSGFLFLRWLDKISSYLPRLLRLATRDLARHPVTSLTSFLALGLGLLLLNVVPQIQTNLEGELEHPEQSRLPSLFLFDIQKEQIPSLKAIVSKFGSHLQQISPLVRARLTDVNGEQFEKKSEDKFTRENERENQFRNRGFNLTYRDKLSKSETIVAGREFSDPFVEGSQQIAEISLEKRFAHRLGLKLGDILTFDIQSIPVSGKVINFRKIRWTSFQPNFFVQFQPGVLDLAPKTFLATLPKLKLDTKSSLQNEIVAKLPNISLIDVSRLVQKLKEITQQMSWALQFMAILCLSTGFLVLYSISSHQIQNRGWEMNLFKVLGGAPGFIRKFFLIQFSIIAMASGVFGVIISLAVSYVLSKVLFESLWVYQWHIPLISLLAMIFLSWAITLFVTQKILRQRPFLLLQSGSST